MNILDLPQELLSHVLTYLLPVDIIHFGRASRQTWSFVGPDNSLLWQSAFLQIFDNPIDAWESLTKTARERNRSKEDNWHWHTQLRRRLLAKQAISPNWTGEFLEDDPSQEETIDAIIDIVDTAKPQPTATEIAAGRKPQIDDRESLNISHLPSKYDFSVRYDLLVRGSFQQRKSWSLLGRPITRSMASSTGPRSEAASRLHVLGGVTEQEDKDSRALGIARRIVYDWNLTNSSNEYGPFKPDGSGEIDWRRLEAACSVATRQFARALDGRMILPQGYHYSIPFRTLRDPTQPDDWARVTGTWCGTYVFLNWEDLMEFNAMPDTSSRPSLENGPESCGGLSRLELRLNDDLKDDPTLQPKLPICNDLPLLFFSGTSRSYGVHMGTELRGMACLTPGGREVRWKFIIYYSGSDQWQLEGVQPGGVRSGCIYGLWTACHHEEDGPVGSFIYAPEELCKTTELAVRT